RMIKYISPIDLYFAALDQVVYIAVSALPTKFAYYNYDDIGTRVPDFFAQAWQSKSLVLFGTTSSFSDFETISSILRNESNVGREGAPVPFTTLEASALGASLLLWLVLAWRLVAIATVKTKLAFERVLVHPSIHSS